MFKSSRLLLCLCCFCSSGYYRFLYFIFYSFFLSFAPFVVLLLVTIVVVLWHALFVVVVVVAVIIISVVAVAAAIVAVVGVVIKVIKVIILCSRALLSLVFFLSFYLFFICNISLECMWKCVCVFSTTLLLSRIPLLFPPLSLTTSCCCPSMPAILHSTADKCVSFSVYVCFYVCVACITVIKPTTISITNSNTANKNGKQLLKRDNI